MKIPIKSKKGKTCIKKRVLKIVTLKEYAEMQEKRRTQQSNIESFNEIISNQTNKGCIEGDQALDLVINLVIIIRNIILFPVGIFLDKYGTSKTRIIAM